MRKILGAGKSASVVLTSCSVMCFGSSASNRSSAERSAVTERRTKPGWTLDKRAASPGTPGVVAHPTARSDAPSATALRSDEGVGIETCVARGAMRQAVDGIEHIGCKPLDGLAAIDGRAERDAHFDAEPEVVSARIIGASGPVETARTY